MRKGWIFLALSVCLIAPLSANPLSADPLSSAPAASTPLVRFGLELDIEPQLRFYSEQRLIEAYDIKSGIDMQRAFFERPPLLRLLLEARTWFGLGIFLEASLRDQWDGDYFRGDNIPIIGVEGDPFKAENYFLSKGGIYWKSPWVNLELARDKVNYNGILYTGLLPGPRLPFLDAVQADTHIGPVNFYYMVASIPAAKSWGIEKHPAWDVNPNAGLPPGAVYYGFETDPASTTILEALSRISIDIGQFNIGITDHVMMARRNNHFYVTDFIPFLYHHQTGISQTNNSLILDASWKSSFGLAVALQAGFDDINANIFGIGDTEDPTIDAYVGGISYAGRVASPYSMLTIDAQLEAGYTHYLWGNYDGVGSAPFDQNPLLRFQYRYLADAGGLLLPLTSAYGPGAVWTRLSGSVELEDIGLRIGVEASFLSKNTKANLIDTSMYDPAIANAPRVNYFEFALPLRWRWKGFEVNFKPIVVIQDEEARIEANFGVAYRLRLETALQGGPRAAR